MAQSPAHLKAPSLPSLIFQQGILDCPSCKYDVENSPSVCPRCQCHLGQLDAFLHTTDTPLQSIMDSAGLVKDSDDLIRRAIEFNERKFPQIHLIFCTAICPEGVKASTIAWWMLNRSTPSANATWSGILLIDPSSNQVTFQAGYDLEVFVNRQRLDSLLIKCGEWFSIGEWAQGTTEFFKDLYKMLKMTHREALKTKRNIMKQK